MSDRGAGFLRSLGIALALGVALGAAIGLVAGLVQVQTHRFPEHGLWHLSGLAILREVREWALYVGGVAGLAQLCVSLWLRIRDSLGRLANPLASTALGLLLAGALLLPLNETRFFPGAGTPLGIALNLGVLVLALGLAVAIVRQDRLRRWQAQIGGAQMAIGGATAGALVVGGWLAAHAAIGMGASGGNSMPSVLLITIDTLRYDHMSLYGYERETTPRIDALARQASVFEQATTPRPKTTPSMAAMLTGLYPHKNGVRLLVDELDPAFVTLAEVFGNAGYQTGAVVSNYVLRDSSSGLGAGFSSYDDETPDYQGTQRDGESTTLRALDWLEKNGDEPFFLWVHYMDPHAPYETPDRFLEMLAPAHSDLRPVDPKKVPAVARIPGDAPLGVYIDRYDAEIRYVDEQVGQLVDAGDALRPDGDLVIALTSDHGESLGEHDYFFEHGFYLYDATVRLPLLLRYPGVRAGARISDPVEIIDLFPTLTELAGVNIQVETDGRSLLPLLTGQPGARAQAYVERTTVMKAVRTPGWKLIYTYGPSGEVERKELYNLARDPGETENLYESEREQARSLADQLRPWSDADPLMASQPGLSESSAELSPEEREKLQALGYLE